MDVRFYGVGKNTSLGSSMSILSPLSSPAFFSMEILFSTYFVVGGSWVCTYQVKGYGNNIHQKSDLAITIVPCISRDIIGFDELKKKITAP